MKFFIALILVLPFYVHASCNERIKLQTIKTPVYRCEDSTISFTQPTKGYESDIRNEWEGLCGAVAAANVFHAFCKNLFVDPVSISNRYFRDITPGIRPDVLERGLNRMFNNNPECAVGEWKYYYVTNRYDFIRSLDEEVRKKRSLWQRRNADEIKPITPVIVLFSEKGDKLLHYVTVIDVLGFKRGTFNAVDNKECEIVFNDYGRQKTVSCDKFATWAQQVDDSVLTRMLPEYIHFVFETK